MTTRSAIFGKRGILTASPPAPVSRPVASVVPDVPVSENKPGIFAKLPWLTFVICGVLISKFNIELRAATDYLAPHSPGHFSLLAFGASSRTQIFGAGEWWRLFTAPLLHASPSHLVSNLIALLMAGWMLEPLVGIGWFGAVYFIGGLAGTTFSILMNPADLQSVGASGAIMSCLACLFALSFHEGVRNPNRMRRLSGVLLFPALRSTVGHGALVDVSAHLGGMIAGIMLAFTLLILWPENTPRIPGRRAAATVAGGFIALTVTAFALSWTSYSAYAAQAANFIPANQLSSPGRITDEITYDLVAKYPDDPRGHMLRAIYFLQARNFDGSESQLLEAKQLAGTYRGLLPPAALRALRASLAMAVGESRGQEPGRRLAAPLCADPDLEPKWRQQLAEVSLCGGDN